MYVMLLATLISLIFGFAEKKEIASTIMLIVLLYLFFYEIWNHQLNKNNVFLCCRRSLLVRLGCQKPILIFDFACTLKI